MAQEVRSILFTADETHKAVVQLLMQRIRGLNPNWIDRIEVQLKDGAVRAVVHFSKELSTSRPLDAHELMTALLLYCRHARIPLSNRAQKRIDVIGGCLSLSSALNLRRIDPWIDGGTIVHSVAETGLERSPAG